VSRRNEQKDKDKEKGVLCQTRNKQKDKEKGLLCQARNKHKDKEKRSFVSN
jgi:hypothetical protein